MARYAGRSVADLSGNCHALVVADSDGLAIAALDEIDPQRATLAEVLELAGLETDPDPVVVGPEGETNGTAANDLQPTRRAHPQDIITVPSPSVLRAQGTELLAWSDELREYVAINGTEMAVLASSPGYKTVSAVASDLSCEPDEIASAVGTLAMIGIFFLEESSEPLESPTSAEPEELYDELEVEPEPEPEVEVEPEIEIADEPQPEPVGIAESDELPAEKSGAAEELDGDRALDSEGDEHRFEIEQHRSAKRRARRLAKAALRPGVRAARRLVRTPLLSRALAIGDEKPEPSEQAMSQADSLENDYLELERELVAPTEDRELVAPKEDEVLPNPELDFIEIVEDDEHRETDQGDVFGENEIEDPRAEEPLDDSSNDPVDMEPEVGFSNSNESDARVAVYGVYHSPEHNANLGLAMIMAYSRVHQQGTLNNVYDIRKARIDSQPMLDEIERRDRSCVVLFSDYMWSIDHNLDISAEVKRLVPNALTVHGGPHAPKYEGDAERFFEDNPHVDVVVRGEGELTIAALLEALNGEIDFGNLDEALGEVEGITFRVETPHGYRLVRTPDRERNADMSIFPSPYLTGEFDEIDPALWRSATIETNRGCPYGCTFCDWGSATLSRIRKFPIERVKAEMEWLASRGISEIFFADANFGIFPQDVEIAKYLAELKSRYNAPAGVICSFAKNTTKYTVDIVRAWVDAGLCAEGSVALQTTDDTTLLNVRRSNIKIEKYDDLAEEFRRLGLPIVTDLLMGLPGSTVESFKTDLQRCIDREVTPRMMETVVLPNSPMNDPDYREQFQIETDSADIVVSTSSYSRDDFDEMLRLRLLFRAFEHYGLLRHLFRWLQHEHEIRAVDLISDIDGLIYSDPHRFPLLTWVGRYFDLMTVPPGGWPPFYEEVIDLLGLKYGIEQDSALATVIEVQEFLMPTRQRSFPAELDLEHDYVAWYQTALGAGGSDKPVRLSEFGPGKLIVDDPAGVCDARLLRNHFSMRRLEACDNPFWVLNDWELRSELMRPMATAVPLLAE